MNAGGKDRARLILRPQGDCPTIYEVLDSGSVGVVQITVADGVATLEVQGLDKLWSLKSRLEIPLAHIRGVRADP